MTIQTAVYERAILTFQEGPKTHNVNLMHAQCVAREEGVTITSYQSEDKDPDSRRMMVLGPRHFISFVGLGTPK